MINVLEYFDETVEKHPDKLAFIDEKNKYTFKELEMKMKAIGSFLIEQGMQNEPVLIFMGKSVQAIASFFGTISAGCYYVPIDSEMPGHRIMKIIENCNPRLCIVDKTTEADAGNLGFEGKIVLFDDISNYGVNESALKKIRDVAIDVDPIYIVFTSGSTGIPKGVAACHRSVIDYIEQLSEVLGISEDTIFGNQAPLYFDACLKELFPTIKFGATTYLIPKQLFSTPIGLIEYLNENKINTICWVVSALTIVSAFKTFDKVIPKYLRTIAFGSEVFPIRQFRIWKKACPSTRFINLYGPTEGTGMSCYYYADREFGEGEIIPIGKPFRNTEVILLNDDGTSTMQGESGEICLRGTCVTLGYYNDPERTSESFVQNPLQKSFPEIIYKTGDIGKKDADGNLIFISRKDNQIKHMGHRIELGEIETAVNDIEGIELTGCIYDGEKNRIILYYTGTITEKDVADILQEKLPRYMMPNLIKHMGKMLFTPNGKIDRKSLKEHYLSGKEAE